MSLLIVVGLMMAQAPAAAQLPAVEVKKPQKVCKSVQITGSRARKKVCSDADGKFDLGPGVSDSGMGKGRVIPQDIAAHGPPGH
jgi:hypothetical protein